MAGTLVAEPKVVVLEVVVLTGGCCTGGMTVAAEPKVVVLEPVVPTGGCCTGGMTDGLEGKLILALLEVGEATVGWFCAVEAVEGLVVTFPNAGGFCTGGVAILGVSTPSKLPLFLKKNNEFYMPKFCPTCF